MFEFQIAPTLAGELSLIPIEMQTLRALASRLRDAISAPLADTD